jgi:hypothetical protein
LAASFIVHLIRSWRRAQLKIAISFARTTAQKAQLPPTLRWSDCRTASRNRDQAFGFRFAVPHRERLT